MHSSWWPKKETTYSASSGGSTAKKSTSCPVVDVVVVVVAAAVAFVRCLSVAAGVPWGFGKATSPLTSIIEKSINILETNNLLSRRSKINPQSVRWAGTPFPFVGTLLWLLFFPRSIYLLFYLSFYGAFSRLFFSSFFFSQL
jgi:hypothetical protein